MYRFLLSIILVAVAMCGSAQTKKHHGHSPEMRKEIMDFKVKFLAQEMELSEAQYSKFSELYRQMSEEKRKVFHNVKCLERKLKANKKATDADYEAASQSITDAKIKDAEIEKKYDEKFAAFLSKKQMFKLKEAEDKFRRKIMDMRRKKQNK